MYLRKSGGCGTLWLVSSHSHNNSKSKKKKFGEMKKKRDSTRGDEKVDQSFSWNDLIGVDHKLFTGTNKKITCSCMVGLSPSAPFLLQHGVGSNVE